MNPTPPTGLSCADVLEIVRDAVYARRLPDSVRAALDAACLPHASPAATGPGSDPGERWAEVLEHLRGCAECRRRVGDLLRLDARLESSLRSLAAAIQPSPRRIEETLRKLRQGDGEFEARVYVRRSLRIMLWIVFLPLTFLLATAILAALLRYFILKSGGS